jgi:hypothetical protein
MLHAARRPWSWLIFDVSQKNVSAVLMSWKRGVQGADKATPIRMKTPTGLRLIGFSSQEVGAYYIRMLGLDRLTYNFTGLAAHFGTVSNVEKKTEQIVFFRSERDVDLHLEDRSRFPYQEYQLTSDDLEPKG